jgi:hypothetical protein
METTKTSGGSLQRQLANLKLLSRLIGHELHAQSGAKVITLSREEVEEIQTTIDLFIEEVGARSGSNGLGMGVAETRLVGQRN